MNQFSSVSKNLDWENVAEVEINSRRTRILEELSSEIDAISGMRDFLANAIQKYDEVENNNAQNEDTGVILGSDIGLCYITPNNMNKAGIYDIIAKVGKAVEGFFGLSLIKSILKSIGDCNVSNTEILERYFNLTKQGGLFGKFSNLVDASVVSGTIGLDSKNKDFGVSAEGSLLGYKTDNIKLKSSWDLTKGNLSLLEAKVGAEGHLAKGQAEAYLGLAKATVAGTIGAIAASGKVDASLVKDGKFDPSIGLEAKVEGSVAKGDAEIKFGSDKNNIHAKASGQALSAEASAKANLGKIEYEDSEGNKKIKYGAEAKVGAEAYVAKGNLSGGVSVLGVKINASVGGKLVGTGLKAGGSITNSSASGEFGLGLLIGADIKIDVDWSNADWDIFNWFK